jgi:hypothetical protein
LAAYREENHQSHREYSHICHISKCITLVNQFVTTTLAIGKTIYNWQMSNLHRSPSDIENCGQCQIPNSLECSIHIGWLSKKLRIRENS